MVAILAKVLGPFFNQLPLRVINFINHRVSHLVNAIVPRLFIGKHHIYSLQPFRFYIYIRFNINISDFPTSNDNRTLING